MQLTVDLLNPSAESEARKHKLKRLVQSPNSYSLPSEKFSLGDILGEAGKTANGFLFDPDFDFQETGEEWSDTVSARGDDEIAVDPDPYYDTPAFPTEDAPSEEGGGLFGGGGLGGMFGAFHTWTAEPDTPSFRLNDALTSKGSATTSPSPTLGAGGSMSPRTNSMSQQRNSLAAMWRRSSASCSLQREGMRARRALQQ